MKTLEASIDPRSVDPLIAALKDSDSDVRNAAAEALGQLSDPRAVDPLIAALKDYEASVRSSAAKALGKLGEPRAADSLLMAMDDWQVAKAAADALVKLGDPASLINARRKSEEPFRSLFSDALKGLPRNPAINDEIVRASGSWHWGTRIFAGRLFSHEKEPFSGEYLAQCARLLVSGGSITYGAMLILPGLILVLLMLFITVEYPAMEMNQTVFAGFELSLMSIKSKDHLPNIGKKLIVVALVDGRVHVRIFDEGGTIVIDKQEKDLIPGSCLTALSDLLNKNPLPVMSNDERKVVFRNAGLASGHLQCDEFLLGWAGWIGAGNLGVSALLFGWLLFASPVGWIVLVVTLTPLFFILLLIGGDSKKGWTWTRLATAGGSLVVSGVIYWQFFLSGPGGWVLMVVSLTPLWLALLGGFVQGIFRWPRAWRPVRKSVCQTHYSRFAPHARSWPIRWSGGALWHPSGWDGDLTATCGCRVCGKREPSLPGVRRVVAVLDDEGDWVEQSSVDGELRVNWMKYRRPFDLDSVEIDKATDADVEAFTNQVRFEGDHAIAKRLPKLPCRVDPACGLSDGSRRLLEATFGEAAK